MDNLKSEHFIRSEMMAGVIRGIVERLNPQRIYLYNQRINSRHEVSSFKLCIIADMEDKAAAERNIYMEIDCEIPFDILIYTSAEWEQLIEVDQSFAGKIRETGTVVYDGKA